MSVTFSQSGINIKNVAIPFVVSNDVNSVVATRTSLAQIEIGGNLVSTFYNPQTNIYKPVTDSDVASAIAVELKTIIGELKAASQDAMQAAVNASPVDKTRFEQVVPTAYLVTSVLTKLYVAASVSKVSCQLENKNMTEADIDAQIGTVKALLKDTFRLVVNLDGINDAVPSP